MRISDWSSDVCFRSHKRRQPETGRAGGRRHVDLSHVIEDGLVTYPGLPAVQVCDYLSREQSREHYEAGTEFHIASIEMVANTGTYIDCPFHRYADGADLSQVEAVAFADLDGIVVRAGRGNDGAIVASFFRARRSEEHPVGKEVVSK